MEAFYCYAYIPTYIFLITSELVLIYLFSRVIAFHHMENFISGVFAFFFYITVVSQQWQYKESKLLFVFVTSHLLLNQLHAFK